MVRIPPSDRLTLRHPDEPASLILYAVIPWFFADPEATFDLVSERHKEVPPHGHTGRTLGRINSTILASHDGLDGRASRARSNFDYFVDQFSKVMDERERAITVDLIRKMGGCAEINRLILALGEEPCEFSLPSIAHSQWRLQLAEPTDRMRGALALIEPGPDGRRLLYPSGSLRPESLRELFVRIATLPKTVFTMIGARRRWTHSVD